MPSPYNGVVVFDIVGTLVSFTSWHDHISQTIGPKLLSHNLSPQAFAHTWMTHAELDYTFLFLSERYTPYSKIMSAVFYRTLYLCGIPSPCEIFTDAERDECQAGYAQLELRPGAKECIGILRGEGFDVRCLTTADLGRVQGYFQRGGVVMPAEKFVSCDSKGICKPALAAYRPAFDESKEVGNAWFAAAHMWDVSAAVKVGFKGAYCSAYEEDACLQVYGGAMDVMAKTLPEMARKIVEQSKA